MSQSNFKDLPFEIQQVDSKLAKELMADFKGELTGFVRAGPKGYFFVNKYRDYAASIYNLPLRPTDTFVVTYPRSGTTLTQELVWMVANDMDYNKSANVLLSQRFPMLESDVLMHPDLRKQLMHENKDINNQQMLLDLSGNVFENVKNNAGPRFIKTHLPLSVLPSDLLSTARVVYVARDPRDVVVSYYHLTRDYRYYGYVGDFKTFWNYFRNNLLQNTPYFEHLKEAWKNRYHPNMLFLFYEELTKDLSGTIRRVADFLGKTYTDEQIEGLNHHLSIDNFKKNKSLNRSSYIQLGLSVNDNFIRKGKSGGWKEYFDAEMTEEAEKWIADNLKDTDLKFPRSDKFKSDISEKNI